MIGLQAQTRTISRIGITYLPTDPSTTIDTPCTDKYTGLEKNPPFGEEVSSHTL